MPLGNSRTAFGWVAIALHWISALGVSVLYLLGDRIEEAATPAAKLAAGRMHVAAALLLFAFLAARLLWSALQPQPRPLEHRRGLRILAKAVQKLFLLMIALLLVSGPLVIWSAGHAIEGFGGLSLPSPFPGRVAWLHEAAEVVHSMTSKLFWPLLALHVAGALKHLVVDRDRTLQRMLWVRREADPGPEPSGST